MQMVAGQVERVGSVVGFGTLFQNASLQIQVAMTLSLNRISTRFSARDVGACIIRRAKKEKMDAFLRIEVRILEIMISGRMIRAVSVSMFVISK